MDSNSNTQPQRDGPQPSAASAGSAIQRTCWYTGAVTRMCNCGGPQIPVSTDGRTEWANCPICGKAWDMKTLMELPNEKLTHEAGDPKL